MKKNNLCEECGIKFDKTRKWKRFCSEKCQFKNWARKNPRVNISKILKETREMYLS